MARTYQDQQGNWWTIGPNGQPQPQNMFALNPEPTPIPGNNFPQSTPPAIPTPTPQQQQWNPAGQITVTGSSPNVSPSVAAQPQYYPDTYNQDVFSQQYGFQGGEPSGGINTGGDIQNFGGNTNFGYPMGGNSPFAGNIPNYSDPFSGFTVGTNDLPPAIQGSPGSPSDFTPQSQGGAVLTGQPDIAAAGGTPQNDITGFGGNMSLGPQLSSNNYYDAGNGTTYVYDSNWNYMYTSGTPQVSTPTQSTDTSNNPFSGFTVATGPAPAGAFGGSGGGIGGSYSGALGSSQDPSTGLGVGPTFDTSGAGEGGSPGMFGGSSLDPAYLRNSSYVPPQWGLNRFGQPGGAGGASGGVPGAGSAPKYF